MDYKWFTSSTLVSQLVRERLQRFGYGGQILDFDLDMHWFDELDIFHNFRYQDPLGLSTTGAGEAGRYYYVEGMDYDFMAGRIKVSAIDLQFLLRQYFILGDEDDLAVNWSSAGEPDRMYGYLCDETLGAVGEGEFADGEPGKILVDENILEDY